MDDITNKSFDRVEKRIDDVRAELTQVKEELSAKLDNVARGLERTLNSALSAGFAAAAEQRRQLHAETMRKFQFVIDEAERMGAIAARDRRVSELEAEVTALRERLARVEQVVGTSRGGT